MIVAQSSDLPGPVDVVVAAEDTPDDDAQVRETLAGHAEALLRIEHRNVGHSEALMRMEHALGGHAEALLRIEHTLVQELQGRHPRSPHGVDQMVQQLMRRQYESMIASGVPLPSLAQAEARFYSQNGEDGIIQMLLAAVGATTRRSVEMCAGDGIENNSTNLIINHGFEALLLDGSDELLTVGQEFYANNAHTWYRPPVLQQTWITRDTINDVVTKAGFAGDIDLLTVDVDGVDYWIWQALTCVNPSIVVTECNVNWRPDLRLTVPYSDTFIWPRGTGYLGASVGAMVALAQEKGYRFVGMNTYGFNAFFVREDLARDTLPTVKPEDLGPFPMVPVFATLESPMPGEWVQV